MGGLLFMLAALGWFLVCVYAAIALGRRTSRRSIRVVLFAVTVSLLFPLPVLDGLWGAHNLDRLCEKESQTVILGVVEVPASLKEGDPPKYLDRTRSMDLQVLRPYVIFKRTDDVISPYFTKIKRTTFTLERVSDGVEVARQTHFRYDGGWLRVSDSGDGFGARTCLADPPLETVLPKVLIEPRSS
jgi:hypothetical protein